MRMFCMNERDGSDMLDSQMSMSVRRKEDDGSGKKKMGYWLVGGLEEGRVDRVPQKGMLNRERLRNRRRLYTGLVSAL
jgi:hypothetical protein